MKGSMSYWVTLIVIVWMSVMVRKSKGVRSIKDQVSQFVEDRVPLGTKWAFLVAGSNGFENYRHQANVCHAYQVLKSGGLKDENIIVMMFDDIAYHPKNPKRGVIMNRPNGPNVYRGVPKDYTGNNVNPRNFFAVLSGNKSATIGGSGKVLNTNSHDSIFIYMSGHGAVHVFGLINKGDIWAADLVNALKKKHAALAYKKMVIYIESCHSGSMLENLLPGNIGIYATTASKVNENSYAMYCPGTPYSPPAGITFCLGDTYSISWMEDSETSKRSTHTLYRQYLNVAKRMVEHIDPGYISHVMKYGDTTAVWNDAIGKYFGDGSARLVNKISDGSAFSYEHFNTTRLVKQDDASLLHLKLELEKAPHGSEDKSKAQKELDDELARRKHEDHTINLIVDLLFGEEKDSIKMDHVHKVDLHDVDYWDCLKMLWKTYQDHCGILSPYGKKLYSKVSVNMCNVGISETQIIAATSQACPIKNHIS
ncbi:vacuolar-processing enzyme-like [Cicer arietinum]|uniref:Vacuolar-processing enzyme-like n=1 Tax=Cicer arietinum TaxID=3827 RepID=A0A3Q7Y9L6_CICAR|nr:vacuolar-processing enzyme-like [Cicer arietinum]